MATDWQNGQKEKKDKNKTAYTVPVPYTVLYNYEAGWRKGFMRKIGLGVLRNVVANDRLYVLAHGGPQGSRHIAAARGARQVCEMGVFHWEGGVTKSYDPEQLAAVIEAEGLLKSFVDLRIFACGSALVPAPVDNEKTRSFAENLLFAMRDLGYHLIQVTGYQGSVRSAYAPRSVKGNALELTSEMHKGVEVGARIYSASDFMVVFGRADKAE